jgi:8-oxo-dGTP diphosphatase
VTSNPGTEHIGVGVGGVILGADGRVLLSRRGPKARNRIGQWENPGGSLEFGEEFDEALVREIREELCIEVRVEGVLRIVNHIIPADRQHWVSPTLVCRHVSGVPRIMEPDKCSAVEWFSLDALPEPLAAISAADLAYLRHLRQTGRSLLPVEWTRSEHAAAPEK